MKEVIAQLDIRVVAFKSVLKYNNYMVVIVIFDTLFILERGREY